ncbi:MAG: mannosyltransferase family protein [Gemmataceae bacterium]
MRCPEDDKPLGWGLWVDTAVCYWTTAAIVVLGVCLGHFYLTDSRNTDYFHSTHRTDVVAAFANWDGRWYARIAREGYSYDPKAMSSVAFYPAFPLTGRVLAWGTGLDYDLALTLAANVCFFLALALLGDYLRRRPGVPAGLPLYACLALALFPVGFFFRMAYSESLFLLLAILVLYGLVRRWPIVVVAALVGLATAARPVGLALAPPLLLAGWRRYPSGDRRRAALVLAAPLCVWGLAAYMVFQYVRFGDALAFAKAQIHWSFRAPSSPEEKLLAAASLESLWSVYDESSPAYWRRHDLDLGPVFSLHFANSLYFTGVALLVAFGTWRRWLSAEEVLFAAGALLIPYLSIGYQGCMHSHARYATAAFPVYLVLGRMLMALPPPYAAAVLALFGFLLGTYAALFAGWFFFI